MSRRGWVPTQPEKTGGMAAAKQWLAARLIPEPGTPQPGLPGEPEPLDVARAVARHVPVTSVEHARETMRQLVDELTGLGPLAGYARNPDVTDILVDGHGQVWTDSGDGLQRTRTTLAADAAKALAVRLLGQGGKRLDEGVPFGDVQIGRARVHAVLPPIATAGPQLSIRLPSRHKPDLTALADQWLQSHKWFDVLHHLLHFRTNLLISGATGSGKTTLLAALLATADPTERIVTIEDTPELQVAHPHVVGLATRQANTEGRGEIGLSVLIRQALRMRPDRLIVGECRGAEVPDFLAAMNTGHRGAIGTVHANSAADVPARLHAMAAMAGLDTAAATLQIRSAIDGIVHIHRDANGQRYPSEITVVDRHADDTDIRLLPVLTVAGDQVIEGPGLATLDGLTPPTERAA